MKGVAVIGCGLIGRTHANVMKGLREAGLVDLRLITACDVDEQHALCLHAEAGFEHWDVSLERALDRPEVDVVYVCTPTRQHAAVVDAAVARGHALFCEKPLAHTASQARAIADAARGVPAQVGLVLRYSAVFAEMRALLSGVSPMENAGRPVGALFRDDQRFPVGGIYHSRWRADAEVSGGGTIIEHSIHDIDLLRWLLGEIRSVYARTAFFSNRPEVEDLSSVVFEFESGAQATLLSIWHEMAARTSERLLEIFCERGWVRAHRDFSGPLEVQAGDSEMVTISEDDVLDRAVDHFGFGRHSRPFLSNCYFTESLAFFRSLEAGKPPWPGLDEAVRAHQVVDAIYQSAQTGQAVALST